MLDMGAAKRSRHETLDGETKEFALRPAEHLLEGLIGRENRPLLINRHHALRGRLEQHPQRAIVLLVSPRLKCLFGTPMLGEVQVEASQAEEPPVGVAYCLS